MAGLAARYDVHPTMAARQTVLAGFSGNHERHRLLEAEIKELRARRASDRPVGEPRGESTIRSASSGSARRSRSSPLNLPAAGDDAQFLETPFYGARWLRRHHCAMTDGRTRGTGSIPTC